MTEPTRYTPEQWILAQRVIKLLEALAEPCDQPRGDDHAWRVCRRCLAAAQFDEPNEAMSVQLRAALAVMRQAAADAREVVDLRMKVLEHAAMATFIRGGDTPRTIEAARLVLCQRLETAEVERDRLARELEALREEMKGWQSGAATEAARGDRLARVVSGMREWHRMCARVAGQASVDTHGCGARVAAAEAAAHEQAVAELDRLTATGEEPTR